MIEPINAAEMTAEQKLQFLEDQVSQCRSGELKFMLCPYCGHENKPANPYLCCNLFADATKAILDRIDKIAAIDFMENVSDRAALNISKYVN